jgi:hypothetical protein
MIFSITTPIVFGTFCKLYFVCLVSFVNFTFFCLFVFFPNSPHLSMDPHETSSIIHTPFNLPFDDNWEDDSDPYALQDYYDFITQSRASTDLPPLPEPILPPVPPLFTQLADSLYRFSNAGDVRSFLHGKYGEHPLRHLSGVLIIKLHDLSKIRLPSPKQRKTTPVLLYVSDPSTPIDIFDQSLQALITN